MKLRDGKSEARVESMVLSGLLVGAFLSWSLLSACGGNEEGQPFEGEENPGESSDDEFNQVEEVVEPEEIDTPADDFGGGDNQVPQSTLDQNQGSYPGQNPAQGKVLGVGQNPGQGSLVDGKGGKLAGKGGKGASQSGTSVNQGPYQGQWSGKGEPSKVGGKGVQQAGKAGKGVDQSYGGVAQGPEQTYKGGPQQSPYADKGVSQMGKGGKGAFKGKGVDQGGGPAQAPHLMKTGSPSQGGKLAKHGAPDMQQQQQQSSPTTTAATPSLPSRHDQMAVSCTQDVNYRLVVGGQHFLLNRYVTAFYADEASLNDPSHSSGYKDFATIIFNELFEISASNLASWVVRGGELVQARGLTFNQDTVVHGSTPIADVVHGHYSVSRHSVQGESRGTKFDLAAYGACLALYQSDDGTYLGDQALVLVIP